MNTTSLASLVETSQTVSGSRSRLAKVAALAAFLRTLAAEDLGIAVNWLTGVLPQGKSCANSSPGRPQQSRTSCCG
jgi:hypothetical protein